jgi:hypothetical protein
MPSTGTSLVAPLRGAVGGAGESVAVLAGQEIADDGFAVGLGGIGLVKGDAEPTMVVQDQVDGDIVEGLGQATAHGALLTLNSTPAHLSPCRGICDESALSVAGHPARPHSPEFLLWMRNIRVLFCTDSPSCGMHAGLGSHQFKAAPPVKIGATERFHE